MYVHSAFKTDEAAAWNFVAARGFGSVIAVDGASPVGSQVPLLVTDVDGQRRIEFHVARANPLHQILAAAPRVLVVVAGPDAYISPDWYVSTDQVPTWNYSAAHISGTARPMPADRTHAHVEAMSLAFEARLAPKRPWSTSKMTPERLAMMLRAIVPIEIEVERIDCAFKASQNKGVVDRMEAARMLDWRGSPNELGVADAMRRALKSATQAK